MTGPIQALAKLEKGGMVHPLGFTPRPGMSYHSFVGICVAVREMKESINFVVGDLIIEGEKMFGDEVYQALEELDISVGTKQQCIRVAERIPQARRRGELKWSHHRAVAAFEPEEQDRWLQEAIDRAWTKGELEQAIRDAGAQIRELDPVAEPAPVYVVEPVLTAAERVYAAARPSDDTNYTVPAEPILDLGRALGAL